MSFQAVALLGLMQALRRQAHRWLFWRVHTAPESNKGKPAVSTALLHPVRLAGARWFVRSGPRQSGVAGGNCWQGGQAENLPSTVRAPLMLRPANAREWRFRWLAGITGHLASVWRRSGCARRIGWYRHGASTGSPPGCHRCRLIA